MPRVARPRRRLLFAGTTNDDTYLGRRHEQVIGGTGIAGWGSTVERVRWVVRLAFVGVVYSAGVVGWLMLPGDRPVPTLVWVVAYLGLFPVFCTAVVIANRQWRGRAGVARSALKRPGLVVVVAIVTLAALMVTALVLTAVAPLPEVPPGQPQIVDGRHVLNNHGVVTSVSRQEYLRALEADQRGFAAFALFFYLLAALIIGMTGERLTARGGPNGASQS
jgi:hypothetical protein